MLTAEIPDATGYGRMVRGARGELERIVEHRDATPAEREIREINSGIYCADRDTLLRVLPVFSVVSLLGSNGVFTP